MPLTIKYLAAGVVLTTEQQMKNAMYNVHLRTILSVAVYTKQQLARTDVYSYTNKYSAHDDTI